MGSNYVQCCSTLGSVCEQFAVQKCTDYCTKMCRLLVHQTVPSGPNIIAATTHSLSHRSK